MSRVLLAAAIFAGCEAKRTALGDPGPGGDVPPGCTSLLLVDQVGAGDPVVVKVRATSRCASAAAVEVRLGASSDVVALEAGVGRGVLDCAGRDRTVVARFLAAGLSDSPRVTLEVDCGYPAPPPPAVADLTAPAALAAYRCETGQVQGVSADALPPIVCAGPGVELTHERAQVVPCDSCDAACWADGPPPGDCTRLFPDLDSQGRYSVPVRSRPIPESSAAVCAADRWGRVQVTQVDLQAVSFIGAWISPTVLDLGPDYRSGQGRACAQANGRDGRPLASVPLRFESTWGTVFVSPLATTDRSGVACVDLLATGAVSPTATVRVTVVERCGGGSLPVGRAPVRVRANPASPAHSELVCTPEVLPAFGHAGDVSTRCELSLRDRFGKPSLAPVEVGFATEAGTLAQLRPRTSREGAVAMTVGGNGPRPIDVDPAPGEPSVTGDDGIVRNPRDGYVTVIAWWTGEEEFTDGGDGVRSPDEAFIDLGAPFVDADDDGRWSLGEWRLSADVGVPGRPGNGQWDSDGVVWTETRVVFTDVPDPAAALDELSGCGGGSSQCGDEAWAFEIGEQGCRLAIPLHDERLNPSAGVWRPQLTVGGRQVRLTAVGGADWEFQRVPGVDPGAFGRGVGFRFDGPAMLTGHLSSSGLPSGPTDLGLTVEYDRAGPGFVRVSARVTGCIAP